MHCQGLYFYHSHLDIYDFYQDLLRGAFTYCIYVLTNTLICEKCEEHIAPF